MTRAMADAASLNGDWIEAELVGAGVPKAMAARSALRLVKHPQLVTRDAPRSAEVEHDIFQRYPWTLRCYGDGAGVVGRGVPCHFSTKARAQAVGDVWVRTGVAPADQPAIGVA